MKIRALYWDDTNIEHIARHSLDPLDVEDVCFGKHISFRARGRRYVLYGKTESGNMIMVVLERLFGQVFRPIIARGMTDKEKRSYRRRVGE